MRDDWGSDYELSSEEDFRTQQEIDDQRYIDMVNMEASRYMNSPGPGSD